MLLLSTTPFEKGFITVVKEGQLRLVFIVTDVAVTYRSCTPPKPPPLLSIGFRAFPFGCTSADCQEIGVGHLCPLIMRLLRMEETGPYGEARSSCLVPKTDGNTGTTHTNRLAVKTFYAIASANRKAVGGHLSQGHQRP